MRGLSRIEKDCCVFFLIREASGKLISLGSAYDQLHPFAGERR
jgi:hypothetical protein